MVSKPIIGYQSRSSLSVPESKKVVVEKEGEYRTPEVSGAEFRISVGEGGEGFFTKEGIKETGNLLGAGAAGRCYKSLER